MKFKYYAMIGIVLLLSGAVTISGCVQNQQNGSQNSSPSTVMIQNFAYNPSTLTVKAGTTVTWTNQDSAIHDVASDSGAFASKDLAKGESYTHNFIKSGEYTYHCNEHPSMTGKVIVQ